MYTQEQWDQAQDLILNTTLPITEIAERTNIKYHALYTKAKSKRWLNARDLNDNNRAADRLVDIVRDITGQVTDINEHALAMIEALQNSYRIIIVRDQFGHLHYQNMRPVWPGMPDNFEHLTEEAQQVQLRTIEPSRLQSFLSDIMSVLELKMSNVEFITKHFKGTLPKLDIFALDITRRAADPTIDILASPESPKLLEEIRKQKLLLAAGNEVK